MQPAPAQVLRVGALRGHARVAPGIEQIAAEPKRSLRLVNVALRERCLRFGAGGQGQLVMAEVVEFDIQPVVATGAQPVRKQLATGPLRAEIELDRQLQVVHALFVAQQ